MIADRRPSTTPLFLVLSMGLAACTPVSLATQPRVDRSNFDLASREPIAPRQPGQALYALVAQPVGGGSSLAEGGAIAPSPHPQRPTQPSALALLAQEQRQVDRTRQVFQQAIAADPTHAPTLQAWARLEQDQGNIARARQLFQRAIAADPHDAPTLQAWARLEQGQGDWACARGLFQKATTADPSDWATLQDWARLEQDQHQFQQARTLLQRALTYAPEDPALLTALAEVELQTGHPTLAKELTRRVTEGQPENERVVSEARLIQAQAQAVLGELAAARANFVRVDHSLRAQLEQTPRNQALLMQRIRLLIAWGKLDSAQWQVAQDLLNQAEMQASSQQRRVVLSARRELAQVRLNRTEINHPGSRRDAVNREGGKPEEVNRNGPNWPRDLHPTWIALALDSRGNIAPPGLRQGPAAPGAIAPSGQTRPETRQNHNQNLPQGCPKLP